MIKDIDIRQVLLKKLSAEYRYDPDTIIIEELGLCQGEARIDLALVNGFIHGYEIKSERDTLERLPSQIEIYCRTLDTVTIVASSRHLENSKKVVPLWWGIAEAKEINDRIKILHFRSPRSNPHIEPDAIVQLLWRDEALKVLRKCNIHRGVISKPRSLIWERLVENLTIDELRAVVRQTLKSRKNWRSALQQG